MILLLAVVAAVTGPAFVWRSLTYCNPIVELRAFANRNFMVGVVMTFTVGAALFGGTFLLPLFLARVRDYSPAEVGTTMVVSGLAMFATGPFAGRLVRMLDLRILMFGGFMMCAWGMWDAHAVTSEWGFWQFAGRAGPARRRRHDGHDRGPAGDHVDPAAAHGQERLGPGEPVPQRRRRLRPGLSSTPP